MKDYLWTWIKRVSPIAEGLTYSVRFEDYFEHDYVKLLRDEIENARGQGSSVQNPERFLSIGY